MTEPTKRTTQQGELILELPEDACSLDVLYATAFTFIDRAVVLLDRSAERRTVSMTSRGRTFDQAGLDELARDFTAELVDQRLRERIRLDNRELLDRLHAESFGAAGGGLDAGRGDEQEDSGDLDDLDDLDFLDDPLGIAVPWEEKMAPGAASGAEPSAGDASGEPAGTRDAPEEADAGEDDADGGDAGG